MRLVSYRRTEIAPSAWAAEFIVDAAFLWAWVWD